MAEVTKYQLIPNTNLISDFKTHFSVFRTRKSTPFIFGVVLFFVLFTVFLAFTPSSSSSSPWFINVFAVNSTSPPTYSEQSYRSHFSSIFSYFFPNSTQNSQIDPSRSQFNATFQVPISNNSLPTSGNLTKTQVPPDKVANFEQNTTNVHPEKQKNQTSSSSTNVAQISPFPGNNTIVQSEKQKNQSSEVSGRTSSTSKNSTIVQSAEQGNEKQRNQSSAAAPQISPVSQNSTSGSSNSTKNGSADLTSSPLQKSAMQGNEKQGSQSSTAAPQISPVSPNSTLGSSNSTKNGSGLEVKSSDFSASLSKRDSSSHTNGSVSGEVEKQGNDEGNLVASLVGCDLYDGEWVRDESYPLYKPGSCKLVDEQFNCLLNGRPDNDYQKLKWKPNGCTLPRLNGGHMLKLLRGKRLVFVGDSLNRNMWESLVCILKNSVKNRKHVYEAFGRHSFRTEASYSFVFKDYNCTVEFFVSPFLVQQWEVQDKSGTTKETLRLDLMVRDSDQFKNADFIVFNTGHWWTHDKTSKGEDYYQEGSHVYKQLNVIEAFRKAITTWSRWVDANINPQRTHVLFRGYSASHFSGGQWNSGGQCDSETEPIRNKTYLSGYPWKMKVFESVIKGMKIPVSYLNVTRMTDYRKDGHPSVYRKRHLYGEEKKSPLRYQDCSHWCLPGVPDSWNELLYAELLRKQYKDQ